MSVNKTFDLINAYLEDVRVFIQYFKKNYNRDDILRAWHDGVVPQSGNVTDNIEYELHGIGCCIYFPDREIDFDFGPNLRTDGFDLWQLKRYLTQRTDLLKNLSTGELENDFHHLVKTGVIEKIYPNSNLYFFKTQD